MIRDTKTCKGILKPSASSTHQQGLSPAPGSRCEKPSPSFPNLQPLSRTHYKSKDGPDDPSRLDKCHCCAGGHLLNAHLGAEDHTSHHTKEKTRGPTAPFPNLRCPKEARTLASLAGVPGHPCTSCHLPSFQAGLKLHSTDGYRQSSQMCTTSGPPMQAVVAWMNSQHHPRMPKILPINISLMQLFIQKNLKNCL